MLILFKNISNNLVKIKSYLRKKEFVIALEEKDFIMRQVKQLAEGMGKFLGLESIKEIINYDQAEEDKLSDDEIETIILMTNLQEIQKEKRLSNEEISKELGITEQDLEELYNSDRFAAPAELIEIRDFVEKNGF